MKIRILYAGGTLGMVDTPKGLAPSTDLEDWINWLLSGTDLFEAIELTTFEHLIDSSNATPVTWQHIIDQLWEYRDEADSFVVIHGTDTMAYASAALSYALSGFGKPVVLTGSQYPRGMVGSDAAPNLTGALCAAAAGRLQQVAVFFGQNLFAGTRVTKTSSWSFQGFESPGAPPLACTGAPWKWTQPDLGGAGWPHPEPYSRHDVLVLDLTPGITAARLAAVLEPAPEAVILRAFGVGNAPDEEPGLIDTISSAIAAGVPVVVASQCSQADVSLGVYQSGFGLAQAGAISSGDMTLEATYAKLVFLLSQGLSLPEIRHWMGTNIVGELSERN